MNNFTTDKASPAGKTQISTRAFIPDNSLIHKKVVYTRKQRRKKTQSKEQKQAESLKVSWIRLIQGHGI